jgi:hypothetical protein
MQTIIQLYLVYVTVTPIQDQHQTLLRNNICREVQRGATGCNQVEFSEEGYGLEGCEASRIPHFLDQCFSTAEPRHFWDRASSYKK